MSCLLFSEPRCIASILEFGQLYAHSTNLWKYTDFLCNLALFLKTPLLEQAQLTIQLYPFLELTLKQALIVSQCEM